MLGSVAEFVYTVLLKPPLLRRAANAVIKAVLPQTVRAGGAVICINPVDPVISGALTLRVYERDEMDFFRANFLPDMTLIDVGANVGLYSGMALATPGFQGRILAIEPHAESRRFLQGTLRSNGSVEQQRRVVVSDLAASDRAGTLTLYENSQNRGDNRIYPDPLLDRTEPIASDTLDRICEQSGIGSVQFLKIDVQGAEAKVIHGAARVLAQSTDCILMTEFWPYGIARSGSDALGYLASLRALGFALYELRRGGKELLPIGDPGKLIARTQARKYANLIGLKGAVAAAARDPVARD